MNTVEVVNVTPNCTRCEQPILSPLSAVIDTARETKGGVRHRACEVVLSPARRAKLRSKQFANVSHDEWCGSSSPCRGCGAAI